MAHAHRKGETLPRFLCQLPSGLTRTHTRSGAHMHVLKHALHLLCTRSHGLPKQSVLHRSLLVSLWGWFVGKVGELTLRWANNNRRSQNTFWGLHSLSVWLITPGMGSADWRLNNLHRVTWWQLETHDAIRSVHEDDKATVHPSVVSYRKSLLLSPWKDCISSPACRLPPPYSFRLFSSADTKLFYFLTDFGQHLAPEQQD